jgi:tRNA(Ile)-lysidine synthase
MTEFDFNLSELFSYLPVDAPCGLAVSGGGDSIALLHLFALWRERRPLPNGLSDIILTVDHGLRKEAASEVRFVLQASSELGLSAIGLKVNGLSGGSAVQSRAREARYKLMGEALQKRGIAHLITGHTLDDQAETVLMRLKRGSGIEGLRGMSPMRDLFGVTIHRPLLPFQRAELRAWLSTRGKGWVEDPSNLDENYERVDLRARLDVMDPDFTLRQGLALSAQRVSRAHEALQMWVKQSLADVTLSEGGGFYFSQDNYHSLPDEIQLRVLERVISAFGRRPSLSKLEVLHGLLAGALRGEPNSGPEGSGFRYALAGVLVEWSQNSGRLRFLREWQRDALPVINVQLLDKPSIVIWDGRLEVTLSGEAGQVITLRAFTKKERVFALKGLTATEGNDVTKVDEGLLGGALTVWAGGRLVALPQFGARLEKQIIKTLEVAGLSETGAVSTQAAGTNSKAATMIECKIHWPFLGRS